jgi:hypothetical protein
MLRLRRRDNVRLRAVFCRGVSARGPAWPRCLWRRVPRDFVGKLSRLRDFLQRTFETPSFGLRPRNQRTNGEDLSCSKTHGIMRSDEAGTAERGLRFASFCYCGSNRAIIKFGGGSCYCGSKLATLPNYLPANRGVWRSQLRDFLRDFSLRFGTFWGHFVHFRLARRDAPRQFP